MNTMYFLLIAAICYFASAKLGIKLAKFFMWLAIALAVLTAGIMVVDYFVDFREVVKAVITKILGEDNFFLDFVLHAILRPDA